MLTLLALAAPAGARLVLVSSPLPSELNERSDGVVRLSADAKEYDWELLGFPLTGVELKFTNIGPEPILLNATGQYRVYDETGALVREDTFAADTEARVLEPGASEGAFWFGGAPKEAAKLHVRGYDDGRVAVQTTDKVPPGTYRIEWPYWHADGKEHAVSVTVALVKRLP